MTAPGLLPAPYRIAASEPETDDTRTLSLVPAGGGEPLRYSPGQFTMVYAFGAGEVPISISGDPAGSEALVHTIRAVGKTTRAICGLDEGDVVGIRGPYGRGWPEIGEIDGDLVIVAGGLGLAPLRPALYDALRRRELLDRLVLLYGGREPEQLLFRDELEQWRRRDDLELDLTVDVAPVSWRGRVGLVPSLIERLELDPGRTTALLCGPEVMIRFCAAALVGRGVAPERLHVSMERNMRCAVGHCGHCQWGGSFVCKDGPVFDWSQVAERVEVREL